MDPIKTMISAADPVHNDPSVPDGEAALRRMLTEPPLFSDSLPRNDSSLADRRRRWAKSAGVLTVAAAAVTAAVLVATNLGSLTADPAPAGSNGGVVAPTTSPALTATTAPSAAPSMGTSVPASAAPTSGAPVPQPREWRTFLSADGKISFDYPAQWTVAALPGAAGSSAVDVNVSNEESMVVASLHYGPVGGIGGACLQEPVPYTVLDSVVLDLPYNTSVADAITPRFTFRALQEPDRVTASYGITSSAAGKDGKSCMFYNVVSGPAEAPLYSFADNVQVNAGRNDVESGNRKGAKAFPSMDAARAYMQTLEYLNAKRMITSLKINAG
jgi:hypothetical protein